MPVRYVIICLLLFLVGAAGVPARADDVVAQGTAVVVSTDGYLLAWSGYVQGTSKITATIAGQTYPVTVMKTDDARKLSLLKIQATGLHALAFAKENNGNGNIVGYPVDPFLGTNVKSWQSWYNLVNTPGQPPAIMLYNRAGGGSNGYWLINQRGELAGMMIKNYWTNNKQPWQLPEMPAGEMLPLLTAAGVKPGEPVAGDTFSSATPALALLSLFSAHSTRRVNGKDHAVLLQVPAGEFTMGSSKDDPRVNNPRDQYDGIFPDEFPQHKVMLDTFWIYKYEVTVGQYRQFCADTNHPMPALPNWAKDDVPIVNVTWQDAAKLPDGQAPPFPPRRNTRKHRAAPTPAFSPGAYRNRVNGKGRDCIISIIPTTGATAGQNRWAARPMAPVPMARRIWSATCGNGARTGTRLIIITIRRSPIPPVRRPALTASSAAAPGSTN